MYFSHFIVIFPTIQVGEKNMKTYSDRIDLTGRRIGMLTIIAEADEYIDAHSAWICKCDCGNTKTICSKDLIRSNPTRSCGCALSTAPGRNLIDQQFGCLTVIQRIKPNQWLCQCKCGQQSIFYTNTLINSSNAVCGKQCELRKHGGILVGEKIGRLTALKYEKHGRWLCVCDCGEKRSIFTQSLVRGIFKGCKCNPIVSHHPLHDLYHGILDRCHNISNKNYYRYGGRGILLYPEWKESKALFYKYVEDMLGPKPTPQHSLDRINNNLGYQPGNLRWANKKEQANNRRVASQIQASSIKCLTGCLKIIWGEKI